MPEETTKRKENDQNKFAIEPDIIERAVRASKTGERVAVTPIELIQMMNEIDKAINADSGDAEADALATVREKLSELFEDPARRCFS